ncbi:MAG: cell division protein ZapB [Desulfobulbales bacterium]|nr:cell division protein ZapB [Desulfobulbales bacterium]
MENNDNLSRLEGAVEKLLNTVAATTQENQALKARLADKDREIAGLGQQLRTLQGERSQIENRVNGLLDSIEKWEEANESAESAEGPGPATVEKTLF